MTNSRIGRHCLWGACLLAFGLRSVAFGNCALIRALAPAAEVLSTPVTGRANAEQWRAHAEANIQRAEKFAKLLSEKLLHSRDPLPPELRGKIEIIVDQLQALPTGDSQRQSAGYWLGIIQAQEQEIDLVNRRMNALIPDAVPDSLALMDGIDAAFSLLNLEHNGIAPEGVGGAVNFLRNTFVHRRDMANKLATTLVAASDRTDINEKIRGALRAAARTLESAPQRGFGYDEDFIDLLHRQGILFENARAQIKNLKASLERETRPTKPTAS